MTSTTRVPRTEITGSHGGLLTMGMRKMLGGVRRDFLPRGCLPAAL